MSQQKKYPELPLYKVSMNVPLTVLYCMLITVGLLLSIYHELIDHSKFQLHLWMLIFLGLAFGLVVLGFQREVVSRKISFLFMASLFFILTTMRIAMLGNYFDVFLIMAMAVATKLLILADVAKKDIASYGKLNVQVIKRLDWHVLTVRMLIGLVLVPHFTEKLFAGPEFRQDDIIAFTNMGITMPFFFVMLAGVCEFLASLAITSGLFTRLSSLCAAIYLVVATFLGGHFDNGFIWASVGGGWEYPVLWVLLLLCFTVFGPGYFSIDQHLCAKYKVPIVVRRLLMGVL